MGKKYDDALKQLKELNEKSVNLVPEDDKSYNADCVNVAFGFGIAHALNVLNGMPEKESLFSARVVYGMTVNISKSINDLNDTFEQIAKEFDDAD